MSLASEAAPWTLIRKLESQAVLSADELQAIRNLPIVMRSFEAGQDILRDGDQPTHSALVVDGWAFRHQTLAEGRRQILSFHLPGDIPDLMSLHLEILDYSLAALTSCSVAFVSHDSLRNLLHRLPFLADRLWRETMVDASISRGWLTATGRRSAYGRISHLFCELYLRQAAIGLADGLQCSMPLRQSHLADATGLTTIHINRTLRALRDKGLITLRERKLIIHSLEKLLFAAEFEPRYLHMNKRHDKDELNPPVQPDIIALQEEIRIS